MIEKCRRAFKRCCFFVTVNIFLSIEKIIVKFIIKKTKMYSKFTKYKQRLDYSIVKVNFHIAYFSQLINDMYTHVI